MNSKTKKITTIAMLCAVTYVVMVVGRIPVVLFLKYDPSDVIVTLGGLIWGPMTSCIVSVIVASIEMITVSDTACYYCFKKKRICCCFRKRDKKQTCGHGFAGVYYYCNLYSFHFINEWSAITIF